MAVGLGGQIERFLLCVDTAFAGDQSKTCSHFCRSSDAGSTVGLTPPPPSLRVVADATDSEGNEEEEDYY